MIRHLAIALAAAAATSAVTTPLLAQGRDQRHPDAIHAPAAPPRRGRPNAPPEWERGHEGAAVPYVRGDRWYGHSTPSDARFRLDRPYPRGRFTFVGPTHVYSVVRFDLGAHRLWFPGGFGFEIAAWDWPFTGSWCFDCGDRFVVYDDPDHLGWYLLLDLRTGEYVHVQYVGLLP